MLKKFVCIALFAFFAICWFGMLTASDCTENPNEPDPAPHHGYAASPPIRINSDAEFNALFSNRTIWGLEINGTGYGYCIYIGNCSLPFTVKNCYLHNASGKAYSFFHDSALLVYQSSNGTLTGNICTGSKYGIYTVDLTYGELRANECRENGDCGIIVHFSRRNALLKNICSGGTEGIKLTQSENNSLADNVCTLNSGGIMLLNSHANNLAGNNCTNNSMAGVRLQGSDSNTLTGNNLSANRGKGIDLWTACRNTISRNQIYKNQEYGLMARYSSEKNRIHHNTFIDNFIGGIDGQANDTGGKNFWNTTSEGNYWSDWTSPDSDGDGIVDNPYSISGGKSKDWFPLVRTPPPPISENQMSLAITCPIAMFMAAVSVLWKRKGP